VCCVDVCWCMLLLLRVIDVFRLMCVTVCNRCMMCCCVFVCVSLWWVCVCIYWSVSGWR